MNTDSILSKLIRTVIVVCVLGSLSGCAVMLAKDADEAPDLDKIQVGVTRTVVEDELGYPAKERRGGFKYGADTVVQYKYYVREKQDTAATDYDKFKDSFTSFHEQIVSVYYNRKNEVVRVLKRKSENETARARMRRGEF